MTYRTLYCVSCNFYGSIYASSFMAGEFTDQPKKIPNNCNNYTIMTRRLCLKCDGTHAETKLRLSAKWTSPFKSAGVSIRSITGSRGGRISGSNAGYTMFRGSVKGTGYPLHPPVSLSLPFLYITVCHHISTELYYTILLAGMLKL